MSRISAILIFICMALPCWGSTIRYQSDFGSFSIDLGLVDVRNGQIQIVRDNLYTFSYSFFATGASISLPIYFDYNFHHWVPNTEIAEEYNAMLNLTGILGPWDAVISGFTASFDQTARVTNWRFQYILDEGYYGWRDANGGCSYTYSFVNCDSIKSNFAIAAVPVSGSLYFLALALSSLGLWSRFLTLTWARFIAARASGNPVVPN